MNLLLNLKGLHFQQSVLFVFSVSTLKTKIKPCNNAAFMSGCLSTQRREYNEQQKHQTHHFNPNDCRI